MHDFWNDDLRKERASAALMMLELGIPPQEVAEALSDVRKQSERAYQRFFVPDVPSKDF